MRTAAILSILFLATLAGCLDEGNGVPASDMDGDGIPDMDDPDIDGDGILNDQDDEPLVAAPNGFEPHVLVGVSDSGINPYHELYYRADRTAHPCTYVQGMPCDLKPLNFSVGPDHPWIADDSLDDGAKWQAAFEADKDIWESVKPNTWYYIPQTVFVAVTCASEYNSDGQCILDDGSMHGTGTTSSVIMENPDALIAFSEGLSPTYPHFLDKGIPIDVFSFSIGYIAPLPLAGPGGDFLCEDYKGSYNGYNPIYVHSSGNEPGQSSLADCWSGSPYLIQVGGAYAQDDSQEILAYKEPDIVSYFCRPTAQTQSISAMRASYCGTSFSAPTAAGAISKVVLAAREQSGYIGGATEGFIDPILGITPNDVRNAVNLTASYDPVSQYPNTAQYCSILGNGLPQCVPGAIPRNDEAPWTQWGWGFYDATVADATIAHLLDGAEASKPAEAVQYQEAVHEGRKNLYG